MSFPYWESLVTIGKCVKPHGLKGEIGVKPITDFPERFEETVHVFAHQSKDPVRPLEIEAVRSHSGGFLIKFKGVESKDAAGKLRGFFLAVPEDELVELEEDEYWHWELEGLKAVSPDGLELGILAEVIESPAHDLYAIKTPDGKEHLVPAVRRYVPDIDLEAGIVVVILPEMDD
ncbi:MAG: ribosome maturation factor RimM [Vulcanimicrobiota bacterium]